MLEHRHLRDLSRQMDEITSFIGRGDESVCTLKQNISGWSAAEQLDHTLKVNGSVLARVLQDPEPDPLPKPMNLIGRIILALGWIPRGKGRSPKSMRGEPATCPALETQASKVRQQLEAVTAAHVARSRPLVPHPRFGGLSTEEALRFMVVHTEHHLKIVREIVGR
jgi:hypothetical protein